MEIEWDAELEAIIEALGPESDDDREDPDAFEPFDIDAAFAEMYPEET